jgi:hypothetical protein
MQKAKQIWQTLESELIVKMLMFAWGLQLALCHPIKGGNKDNILEWIGLSYNFRPWVRIKMMLQEEGFFLLTSYTNVFSCQEWKEQVEVAFEYLKHSIIEWWDEYISWIQNV